jgi:hypothetical protein
LPAAEPKEEDNSPDSFPVSRIAKLDRAWVSHLPASYATISLVKSSSPEN